MDLMIKNNLDAYTVILSKLFRELHVPFYIDYEEIIKEASRESITGIYYPFTINLLTHEVHFSSQEMHRLALFLDTSKDYQLLVGTWTTFTTLMLSAFKGKRSTFTTKTKTYDGEIFYYDIQLVLEEKFSCKKLRSVYLTLACEYLRKDNFFVHG